MFARITLFFIALILALPATAKTVWLAKGENPWLIAKRYTEKGIHSKLFTNRDPGTGKVISIVDRHGNFISKQHLLPVGTIIEIPDHFVVTQEVIAMHESVEQICASKVQGPQCVSAIIAQNRISNASTALFGAIQVPKTFTLVLVGADAATNLPVHTALPPVPAFLSLITLLVAAAALLFVLLFWLWLFRSIREPKVETVTRLLPQQEIPHAAIAAKLESRKGELNFFVRQSRKFLSGIRLYSNAQRQELQNLAERFVLAFKSRRDDSTVFPDMYVVEWSPVIWKPAYRIRIRGNSELYPDRSIRPLLVEIDEEVDFILSELNLRQKVAATINTTPDSAVITLQRSK